MPHELDISVIICTYNRAEVLRGTLESYTAMAEKSGCRAELVIVDNNSTDDTSSLLVEFCARQQWARYIFEPTPGLSHARNRGIREARCELVAFVDDDVYFAPAWLQAVVDCFRKEPSAVAMGGRSQPIFENGRPTWLSDELLTIYGDTRLGDEPRWMFPPEQPYGLNMAFRRVVFEKIGIFDPCLGRIGTKLLSNEEKDYFHRIASAGLKTWYEPEALLYHRIPASRTRPEWVISRHYWQGVSDTVFNQGVHPRSRFSLISTGVGEVWRALSAMRGRRLSPRMIRWHYHGIPLIAKAHHWEVLGRGWSKIRMAFRLGQYPDFPARTQRT